MKCGSKKVFVSMEEGTPNQEVSCEKEGFHMIHKFKHLHWPTTTADRMEKE